MKQLLISIVLLVAATGVAAQVHLERFNRADSAALCSASVPDSLADASTKYRQFLFRSLLQKTSAETDCCFILFPSRGSVRALIMRPGERFGRLTVRTVISDPWQDFQDGKQPRVIESEQSIEKSLADAIHKAFTEALTHAQRLPYRSGDNGTTYQLLMPGDSGQWLAGRTWSPEEESPLSRLTLALTELLDMPLDGDTSATQRELNALRFDGDE